MKDMGLGAWGVIVAISAVACGSGAGSGFGEDGPATGGSGRGASGEVTVVPLAVIATSPRASSSIRRASTGPSWGRS